MPQDETESADALDWLRRARAALILASQPKPEGAMWEDQSYLAQQAAERALKAVHVHISESFRFTHDIEELARALDLVGIPIPDVVRDAVILTRYAVETRYPGPVEPMTEMEYLESIRLAGAVVAWAEHFITQ